MVVTRYLGVGHIDGQARFGVYEAILLGQEGHLILQLLKHIRDEDHFIEVIYSKNVAEKPTVLGMFLRGGAKFMKGGKTSRHR
ncbi:hypothetical protein D3C85_1596800 [compost metagenome]